MAPRAIHTRLPCSMAPGLASSHMQEVLVTNGKISILPKPRATISAYRLSCRLLFPVAKAGGDDPLYLLLTDIPPRQWTI